MAAVRPVQEISVDEEKLRTNTHEAIVERGFIDTAAVDKDDDSQDGDDALKLAGSRAQQFDEKYYMRLRRKIASSCCSARNNIYERKLIIVIRTGPSRNATSGFCLLHTILG